MFVEKIQFSTSSSCHEIAIVYYYKNSYKNNFNKESAVAINELVSKFFWEAKKIAFDFLINDILKCACIPCTLFNFIYVFGPESDDGWNRF